MVHPLHELHTLPSVIEDLLRGFVARHGEEWIEWLDYERMVRVPDDWVVAKWRCADIVWSIPFRSCARRIDETHVIVMLKFQSDVVPDMGRRIGRHVDLLHLELARRRAFGSPDNPPLLVPIVVYDGSEPWSAPVEEFTRL